LKHAESCGDAPQVRCSAASAIIPAPSRATFIQKDGDRKQSGKRIKPWDVERGICNQASQGGESQISAGGRLDCIGCQSNIVCAPGLSAFESSQDRHGDQSNCGNDDSQSTRLRLYVKRERQ
jgi:hypothetical protein